VSGPTRPLIIGGGLAGAAVAATLAHRGIASRVIADEAPTAGSAVPGAVLTPPVLPATDPLSRLRRMGRRITARWMHTLAASGLDNGHVADGVIVVPRRPRERARRDRIPPSPRGAARLAPMEAAARAGCQPPEAAIFHPAGACVVPARLSNAMLRYGQSHAEWTSAHVERIEHYSDGWQALGQGGQPMARGTPLILATGIDSARLYPPLAPWLLAARGQATAFAPTAATARLCMPVSGGGYITPPTAGVHWTGATLQRHDADPTARAADDAANLDFARELLGSDEPLSPTDHFVGIRCTTRDRFPLAGRLTGDLWITTGHGSHGLITAPLAARIIADGLQGNHRARAHPMAPQARQ
jgi:tRNA 5-methylaminomethyl-2-thiouridine biosynthesis bifunctional protein